MKKIPDTGRRDANIGDPGPDFGGEVEGVEVIIRDIAVPAAKDVHVVPVHHRRVCRPVRGRVSRRRHLATHLRL